MKRDGIDLLSVGLFGLFTFLFLTMNRRVVEGQKAGLSLAGPPVVTALSMLAWMAYDRWLDRMWPFQRRLTG